MQIEVIIEKKLHKLNAEEGKTILETLQEHGIHVLTAMRRQGKMRKVYRRGGTYGRSTRLYDKSNRWYAYHNSESAASRTEV